MRLLPQHPIESIGDYLATDVGGRGIATARRLGPAATIELIAASGLRGRGGGGFPTGTKWAGIARQQGGKRYLVCNGAEGEPGTFKDRALLRANPYQVAEGLMIAAFEPPLRTTVFAPIGSDVPVTESTMARP